MRRREFLGAMGGAAAWPLAAQAQQALPVIGFLHSTSPEANRHLVAAFRAGMGEGGFIDGQNVAIEYRWGQGQYDRLPTLAADLVERSVAVIVTAGGVPPALAAKAATQNIPIVFVIGSDPVEFKLVASLSRPGGNATGVSLLAYQLDAKRIELVRELVPNPPAVAALVNPASQQAATQIRGLEDVALKIGQKLLVINADDDQGIELAFANLAQQRANALIVSADPFFLDRRKQLVALAARHEIPVVYQWREFVDAGGLMSYGTSIADAYRHAGVYAGRILKGAKPADLPVQQAVKVELLVNLKTAKTLGLNVPMTVLGRADEIIE
jgi:putative ABC transport system substrate-binding protein